MVGLRVKFDAEQDKSLEPACVVLGSLSAKSLGLEESVGSVWRRRLSA